MDEVILGEVVPHEPVLVAPENVLSGSPAFRKLKICQKKRGHASCSRLLGLPLARPGVHGGHALAAHHVEMINHICAASNHSITNKQVSRQIKQVYSIGVSVGCNPTDL